MQMSRVRRARKKAIRKLEKDRRNAAVVDQYPRTVVDQEPSLTMPLRFDQCSRRKLADSLQAATEWSGIAISRQETERERERERERESRSRGANNVARQR